MNRAWEVRLKQKRPRNKGQRHKRDTGAGYWSVLRPLILTASPEEGREPF